MFTVEFHRKLSFVMIKIMFYSIHYEYPLVPIPTGELFYYQIVLKNKSSSLFSYELNNCNLYDMFLSTGYLQNVSLPHTQHYLFRIFLIENSSQDETNSFHLKSVISQLKETFNFMKYVLQDNNTILKRECDSILTREYPPFFVKLFTILLLTRNKEKVVSDI